MEKRLSTPTAILLGSALIAVGLFFGMQRRAEEKPPAVIPGPVTSFPTPSEGGGEVRPQAPIEPPAAVPLGAGPAPSKDKVTQQALAALEAHRADIVKKCWKPSFEKQPTPPKAKLTVNVTFDAEGRQIVRGIAEDRETARPDVTQCFTLSVPNLSIPPPGTTIYVEVPFTLP